MSSDSADTIPYVGTPGQTSLSTPRSLRQQNRTPQSIHMRFLQGRIPKGVSPDVKHNSVTEMSPDVGVNTEKSSSFKNEDYASKQFSDETQQNSSAVVANSSLTVSPAIGTSFVRHTPAWERSPLARRPIRPEVSEDVHGDGRETMHTEVSLAELPSNVSASQSPQMKASDMNEHQVSSTVAFSEEMVSTVKSRFCSKQ